MIFGYARELIGRKAVPLRDQARAIEWYCEEKGWDFDPKALFVDVQASLVGKRVRNRAAADALLQRVGPGDHIVVHSFGYLFVFLPDVLNWPKNLRDRAVEVHLCDYLRPISELSSGELLDCMKEAHLQSCRESKAIRVANKWGVSRPTRVRWLTRYDPVTGERIRNRVTEVAGQVVLEEDVLDDHWYPTPRQAAVQSRRQARERGPEQLGLVPLEGGLLTNPG